MRRAELIDCLPEFRLGHVDIFEEIGEITLRELLVIFVDKVNRFLTRDLAVAHFLCGVIGGPTDSEFDQRGEIVEHVDLVVDARILRIGSRGALGIRLKTRIFSGELGVQLFFVISGYVLGLGFYRSAQASRGVGLAGYFMRRFRRLEPPFVLIMTFFFLILLASGRFGLIDGFGHYLASILYLHGIIYWEPSTINTVTWSLEVELQFYVLAPLLYAAYRLPKGTTMTLMSLLAFAFVVTAYAMGDFYLTLLSHGHFFVLGAVFPILGTFRIPKMLAFVFPLALAAYFLIDANYASITGNLAKIGLLTVVFACTLGCEPVRRFLSTPALFIIGGACY